MAECSAPYCHPRLNAVAATVNPAPSSGSAQVSRHHPRWEPGALAAPAGICVVTELGADTDPFLLHIYAALAEKERALISRRTKDALSAAKARGIVIGGLRDKGRELQAEAFERAEALRPVFAELTSSTGAVCPRPGRHLACGHGYSGSASAGRGVVRHCHASPAVLPTMSSTTLS